jgi:hypothetical protein
MTFSLIGLVGCGMSATAAPGKPDHTRAGGGFTIKFVRLCFFHRAFELFNTSLNASVQLP